jgi:hypothetical protein
VQGVSQQDSGLSRPASICLQTVVSRIDEHEHSAAIDDKSALEKEKWMVINYVLDFVW